MSKIKSLTAEEILDSHGNPTVETTVVLSDGTVASSSVPSGTSKSTYEAVELRDTTSAHFHGLGEKLVVETVNQFIAPQLIGIEATEQQRIDRALIDMDGTQNKSKLGANATLSVSQAVMKAAAKSSLLPLSMYIRDFLQNKKDENTFPMPLFNVLEGGKHSGDIFSFQEYLVVPASSKSFEDAMEIGVNVYHSVEQILKERNIVTLTTDQGAFSANMFQIKDAMQVIKLAIEKANYRFALDAFLGIDASANTFKNGKAYQLKDKSGPFSIEDLIEFYTSIITDYSLIYLEDPFAEDDWEGWKKAYQAIGDKTMIVGDDLTSTNPYRLQLALDNKVINGIVIKPNQIGTITETLAVIEMARFKQLKVIVSARGGETLDDFLCDFAVGVEAEFVKFGAPAKERIAKYNRLIALEKELKKI